MERLLYDRSTCGYECCDKCKPGALESAAGSASNRLKPNK